MFKMITFKIDYLKKHYISGDDFLKEKTKNKLNNRKASILMSALSITPVMLQSTTIFADENNTVTNDNGQTHSVKNVSKTKSKQVYQIDTKVNSKDVENIPTADNDEIDGQGINDFEKQKTAGIVNYEGKNIEVKKETSDVKNAPVSEVSENENHEMGSASKMMRMRSRAYGCDVFKLGDKTRPRQDFIDISSYQGGMGLSQFKEMKSKGIKGVVVKLTEGTGYRNPYAAQQIRDAKKAGLQVSTYHFSRFRNKAQAEAEADYYAQFAKELGLGPDTLMVNDAEASELANGYGTQNSIYFALRLIRTHGFNSVLHYMSGSWCGGVLDPNALGNDSLWIAGYPYHPTNQNYQYSNREAWQFSSTMTMNGWNGYLDVNTDYTGRFTKKGNSEKPQEPSKPKPHEVSKAVECNEYKTITSKDETVWGDTQLTKKKNNTNNLYQKTYHAERYYVIDGVKYYSLYSNQDKWIGYVSEKDLKDSGDHGPGGIFFSQDFIGKISDNYAIWRNLDFTGKKVVPKKDEVYHVKGKYNHFNGDTYYSLYDKDDNWIGYINAKGIEKTDNFGNYMSYKKYVSITQKGFGIYRDQLFNKKVSTTDDHMKETYYAKGYYNCYSNGRRYLSLYDKDDKWVGYVQERACQVGVDDGKLKGGVAWEAKNGNYETYVQINSNYSIWKDFDFTRKGTISNDKAYVMEREYHHINGNWYGSLYEVNREDGSRRWLGYMNKKGFTEQNHDFGPYQALGKKVKIKDSSYGLYSSKTLGNDYKIGTLEKIANKKIIAKGYYERFGGNRGTYLSLYDEDGTWLGYANANAFEIL